MQAAIDNRPRRALILIQNKRNFLDVSSVIVGRVGPAFYSVAVTAGMKAFGLR